ncbi:MULTISPECIES: efflux RND transporter periplasmic adaptor subunit [Roseivirga]|jgi:cobalt-zinc-cadmium efflux system membrane fusion protein|uniref:Efflux transporter periplasmic adaptor subunit n=1 Tax=Roseivirga spongicola TaxID=333140 RepID=A0A150XFN0_9BACT|nr:MULTISPECIES: efflux RND transporter periplasmic adaptor subunit [Roseivirga]KYG77512.1 efflux transporter periplasmic adaptor subunit [Roseivirga spongicola]MBO6495528.1 efflux RND transporter periplasmic adaptor subunit [Roseivirga sp.]MBO6661689.1 efflux RND transporter periplasmic adaptor subunit [Roseivirga sp.]MBO6908326.1 efflux RND transporter periplasmic adaptor subunit [Roseivirga sp.]MCO6359183.1 efflux RND transporter periplasmic adaptor subunit [Roseivirga pacifica]|tara:strand:- start:622 stop:1827 length:1206 start_codon:yes stop_codon:yes gene_type:complete
MKKQIIYIVALALMVSVFTGCGSKSADTEDKQESHTEEEGGHGEEEMGVVHLSALKFNSLRMKVDSLPTRALTGTVEANGQLEVPPQYEATVTAILGANVTSIKVIEGDKVKRGQVLAYISHPNITQLQTNYVKAYSRLQYLEKEMQRQKRLYEEEVGSGKAYQETLADYQSIQGEVKGLEAQLKQLSINVKTVREGDIYQNVPVVSPIDGNIEKVLIQIGQFVEPQTKMFMIVNTDHVHADLMVFEKDVYKVKEGQKISFTIESVPDSQLSAEIYSVGKKFEQNPKAVHVHAEIKSKEDFLIPGMYINGKIHTESKTVKALPEEAIIEEEGKPYIFLAEARKEEETEWEFRAIEIRTGVSNDGWVEINLLEPLPQGARVAWNNAYYLIAEMKKGSTEHGH